jgi:nitrogen-specific signal transduction histidine kinase
LLFGATGVILISAAIGWQHQEMPGAVSFVVFMAWAGEWALTYGLQLVFESLSTQLLWTYFQYPGGLLTSVFFGVFALSYTGRDDMITPTRLAGLIALPVITSVVVWIPELRWLVYRDAELVTINDFVIADITHGPLFHLSVGYSYLVVIAGLGLLTLTTLRTRQLYQKQTALITVAAAVPLVGAAISYVLNLTVIDYTPVGLAVVGLSFALALTRYQLLEVYPVPRNQIINHINKGVVVTDAEDRIVDINPAAERLLDAVDVVGRDLTALSSHVAHTVAEMAPDTTTEIEVPGDEPRYFECVKSTLVASGGFGETYLYTFTEITAQRHRQLELEAKNERLDEFAQVISHDLRNPLSVAAGSAELAENDPKPEYFTRIHRAHDRIESLIDGMLTLARSGEAVADTEPTDIGDVAREAWTLVDTKDATLTVVDTDCVSADPQRLQQMFENLFRNAVEHGGQAVTVRVGQTEEGFFIADDGEGIPAELSDSLFRSGVSASADGTGVGLAIVRAVADGHGWELSVGQSNDGGARFDVST